RAPVSPAPTAPLSVPDTSASELYPHSLHDALPSFAECRRRHCWRRWECLQSHGCLSPGRKAGLRRAFRRGHVNAMLRRTPVEGRSEEHTSELQSRENLVCRLLLEKKKLHRLAVHLL